MELDTQGLERGRHRPPPRGEGRLSPARKRARTGRGHSPQSLSVEEVGVQTVPPKIREVGTQAPEVYVATPLRRIPPIYRLDPGAFGIILRFLATGATRPDPGWETVWLCSLYGLVRWEPRPVLRMVVIPYLRNTRREFIDHVMAVRARIWSEVRWWYMEFAQKCRELVNLQWQQYSHTEQWGEMMTPETHPWQHYGRVLNWNGILQRSARKERLKDLANQFALWNSRRTRTYEPSPYNIEVMWPLDEYSSEAWFNKPLPYD